jgi:hypothetical protein
MSASRRRCYAVAWALVAGVAAPPLSAQDIAEHATFMTGRELAEHVLDAVVSIRQVGASGSQVSGMGIVIGGDERRLFVLTAHHVLPLDGERLAVRSGRDLAVRLCSDQSQTADFRELLFADSNRDIAIFSIRRPRDTTPPVALLASRVARSGDLALASGRQGECSVSGLEGAVFRPEDERGYLVIDLPSGVPGTSGAPMVTDSGIVGIAFRQNGQQVRVQAIRWIRDLVDPSISWWLEPANNFPPTSVDAAQVQLTQVVNRYLFALKDVRDALLKETYRRPELVDRIDTYNLAIKAFNDVRDKYDGTLARLSSQLLGAFSAVRTTVDDIHPKFLEINVHMDRLRRPENVVPEEIRTQMAELAPQVTDLDAAARQFVDQFKAAAANGESNATSR